VYEDAFDKALFANLRDGDVVWDVGANVGYYTKRFAKVVGVRGKCIAFEPFPETAEKLRVNLDGIKNYSLEVYALGAAAGKVVMQVGGDELGATNRISEEQSCGVMIEISTGDAIISEARIEAPNVVKIDTEGFELDVLRGMSKLMQDPKLRALFVEVHFGLLAERGIPKAPVEIETLLKDAGFQTRWVDASHIAAERG
jgi:FkbM family methyltransferase